jgi:glycosyltransferase involved in cell wall biosynthesis
MTPPSISVIIPTFDRSATSAASAAEQATRLTNSVSIDVIVVDDASSPRFAAEIKALESQWSCVKTIRLTENQGPGAARNAGLSAARGDWVIFADSDDAVCLKAWVGAILRGQESRADVVAGPFSITNGGTPWAAWSGTNRLGRGDMLYELTLRRAAVWRYAFRRRYLADSAIRFPSLRYGEDLLFILNIANAEPAVWAAGGPAVYEYRTVPTRRQPTAQEVAILLSELEVLRAKASNRFREAAVTSWILRVTPSRRKGFGISRAGLWSIAGRSESATASLRNLRSVSRIAAPMLLALLHDPPVGLFGRGATRWRRVMRVK